MTAACAGWYHGFHLHDLLGKVDLVSGLQISWYVTALDFPVFQAFADWQNLLHGWASTGEVRRARLANHPPHRLSPERRDRYRNVDKVVCRWFEDNLVSNREQLIKQFTKQGYEVVEQFSRGIRIKCRDGVVVRFAGKKYTSGFDYRAYKSEQERTRESQSRPREERLHEAREHFDQLFKERSERLDRQFGHRAVEPAALTRGQRLRRSNFARHAGRNRSRTEGLPGPGDSAQGGATNSRYGGGTDQESIDAKRVGSTARDDPTFVDRDSRVGDVSQTDLGTHLDYPRLAGAKGNGFNDRRTAEPSTRTSVGGAETQRLGRPTESREKGVGESPQSDERRLSRRAPPFPSGMVLPVGAGRFTRESEQWLGGIEAATSGTLLARVKWNSQLVNSFREEFQQMRENLPARDRS